MSDLWWIITVRRPDGSEIEGGGYSLIEAGEALAKKVVESQAEATRAQEHADETAKALSDMGAILVPVQPDTTPTPPVSVDPAPVDARVTPLPPAPNQRSVTP